MRMARMALAPALAFALLTFGLVPSAALAKAKPKTVLGSLSITGAEGAALTTQLVGFAVIGNPGFEKIITVQIPPFTLPFFVDGDVDDDHEAEGRSAPFLQKRFDTTLVLTNTTAASLVIELTLRDDAGALLTTTPVLVTLGVHASKLIAVSALLP